MGTRQHDANGTAAICAALLLFAGLALPYAGWAGLETPGPGLGLAASAALGAAFVLDERRLAYVSAVLAGVASGLIVWRLASVPANPVLQIVRSPVSLWLALAGTSATGVSAAVLARSSRPRSSAGPLDRGAVAVVWRALWTSRLLVWAAGLAGVLTLGIEPSVTRPGLSVPFNALGDLLLAPASSWDASSYLHLARYGFYSHDANLPAFFPGYPSMIRGGAMSDGTTLITGVLVSLGAFAVGLYLLHRLVELDLGRRTADLTVQLVAFSPMALFFSAVYTESLFLALSVGAFYAARREWWTRAGVAGALAAVTRPTGVLLLVPLAIVYLHGARAARRRPAVGRDAIWLLLVPAGLGAYLLFSAAHGDALAPFHAQQSFGRRFAPGLGAAEGLRDGWRSFRQLAAGGSASILPVPGFTVAGQLSDPLKLAVANLTDLAFLVFASVTTVGAFRRLPPAYGAYALVTIAVAVSSPPAYEPLLSLPRLMVVVFPCQVCLAVWARTPGRRMASIVVGAALLGIFAARFASWRWVA